MGKTNQIHDTYDAARCEHCGYDRKSIPGAENCPECGSRFRSSVPQHKYFFPRECDRCFYGPEFPLTQLAGAEVHLVSGPPSRGTTLAWLSILSIGLVMGGAFWQFGGPSRIIPLLFWVCIWMFVAACFVAALHKHKREQRKGPWVVVTSETVTLPRAGYAFARPELIGVASLGLHVGQASTTSITSVGLVRQLPSTDAPQIVLLQCVSQSVHTTAERLASEAHVPYFGRLSVQAPLPLERLVDQADEKIRNAVFSHSNRRPMRPTGETSPDTHNHRV